MIEQRVDDSMDSLSKQLENLRSRAGLSASHNQHIDAFVDRTFQEFVSSPSTLDAMEVFGPCTRDTTHSIVALAERTRERSLDCS